MSTPSWIESLPDQAIAADLEQYASDGVLSYAAALQILDDVASAGTVTSAALTSLQTIADELNSGLAASSYVTSIFDQLVLGSPANASWNVGALLVVSERLKTAMEEIPGLPFENEILPVRFTGLELHEIDGYDFFIA